MRLLVIGGSGFLSGTLARQALRAGHEVWIVTRNQREPPTGVRSLTVDRMDRPAFAETIAQAGTQWDLVVDCIGFEPADAEQDLTVFAGRCERLVFISTDFVFATDRRPFPVDESFARFTREGYGARKRECEERFLAAGTRELAWTILRPGHIYGPGSLPGCLPTHGRDPDLIARLLRGETLRLVGDGLFLQQPVLAEDLTGVILQCAGHTRSIGEIYQVAGPDIVESRRTYEIIAAELGVTVQIEGLPVGPYLEAHPEHRPFLCHRVYSLAKLETHGLPRPSTPIEKGLAGHVARLRGKVP